jgi:hypothetical protein
MESMKLCCGLDRDITGQVFLFIGRWGKSTGGCSDFEISNPI